MGLTVIAEISNQNEFYPRRSNVHFRCLQILCDAMERSSNQWNFMVCPFQNLILHNPVFRKYSWTGFLVFPNQTKEAINRSPGIPSDFATQRYGMSQNDICVGVIFKNIHSYIL